MQSMTLDEIYAEYGKLSLAYAKLAAENHRLKQQLESTNRKPELVRDGTNEASA